MPNKQGYPELPDPFTGKAPEHQRNALKGKSNGLSNAKIAPRKTINLIQNRTVDVTGFIDLDSPEGGIIKPRKKHTPEVLKQSQLKNHLRSIGAENIELFYRIEPKGSIIGLPDNTILYSARYTSSSSHDDSSPYIETKWNPWEADVADKGPKKYPSTPGSRREMLYNSAHSLLPEVYYNAPKSGIIDGNVYIGELITHPDMREALVEGFTLKVIYPNFADEWKLVKNAGNIGLLSGKEYRGYSKGALIAEDFVRAAQIWINGTTNYRYAIKEGYITQEEADSRINFFEGLFKH